MRTSILISLVILSILLFSCKEKEKTEKKSVSEKVENFEPKIEFNEIESDFIVSSPFLGRSKSRFFSFS